MNNSTVTQEPQRLQLLSTPPAPNRIRSHSLKPRHSRQDYARRKSAADASSETMTHLELSTDNNEFEQANTPPPRRSSAAFSQRRYTVVSFEQQQSRMNQQRRMTTGRFSIFEDKSNSNILRNKRPSIISQVVESFARRFSIRKKKNNNDSEPDDGIVDPVYETLRTAAETRKKTLANYLQQKQETLNKQTSLNSQDLSEHDIQSSPRVIRQPNRVETEASPSLKPPIPQQGGPSLGKRNSIGQVKSNLIKNKQSTRHMSLETSTRNFVLK